MICDTVYVKISSPVRSSQNLLTRQPNFEIFYKKTNFWPPYCFLLGCIDENDKKLYEEIAEATKGQAIYFRYDSFLSTMGEYTVKSMTGGSEVPVLPETSPASASRKEYSIVADDNMDTLNLAATLYRNRGTVDVKLYRPGKHKDRLYDYV